MKERDPFSGTLFERSPISVIVAPAPIVATDSTDCSTYDEISRLTTQPQSDPSSRFCMVHMKWESGVAIYIDGKRPLFLCPAEAEKRGAWKWEGFWPEAK